MCAGCVISQFFQGVGRIVEIKIMFLKTLTEILKSVARFSRLKCIFNWPKDDVDQNRLHCLSNYLYFCSATWSMCKSSHAKYCRQRSSSLKHVSNLVASCRNNSYDRNMDCTLSCMHAPRFVLIKAGGHQTVNRMLTQKGKVVVWRQCMVCKVSFMYTVTVKQLFLVFYRNYSVRGVILIHFYWHLM